MEHTHTLQLYGTAGVRYNVGAMARSDVQLMLDVKAGDDASFDLLLQKYRTPLINFLEKPARGRRVPRSFGRLNGGPSLASIHPKATSLASLHEKLASSCKA